MQYIQPDIDKLNQEAAEANEKKDWLNIANSAANGILSAPSAAEIYLNQKRAPINVGLDKVAANVQDPWEKQKKTFEAYKQAKEGEQLEQESNPDDKSTKAFKSMLISKHKLDPSSLDGFNMRQLQGLYGDPKKLAEIQAQSQVSFENDMAKQKASQQFQASEKAKERDFEAWKENTKRDLEFGKKNDPKQKMAALNGTDKARFDNALQGLKAIDRMAQALDSGQNTFSLIGDNDYTSAARNATEAYGRMQSGGAINKDEEARFEKVLPSKLELAPMQRKKLLAQRDEFLSRLKTLGFTPEEIGYKSQDFKYGMEKTKGSQSATAGGGSPKTVTQNGHTYILNEATGEYE